MAADALLVIDAGTSALRSVVVGADGMVRTIATAEWPMFTPDDAAPFGREYQAMDVVFALAEIQPHTSTMSYTPRGNTIGDVGPFVPERIVAVAVTGQREGLAFGTRDGGAYLISPNIDARASAEGIAIDARMADAVYAATGHLPSLMQAPAKWRWLRANRAHDAGGIILPLADFLAHELTLAGGTTSVVAPRMSRSLAVENGLAPLVGVLPDEPYAEVVAMAPEMVADGSILGPDGGGHLGGAPIVLAGADTQCALLGMGIVGPGDVGVPAGWSAPAQMVLDTPLLDPRRRTWTGVHVIPDRWVLESNASETGRAWAWLRMGTPDAEADQLVAASPPGANDVMAVIGPRRMRAHAMSAGVGALTMPLPFVMSAPSRGDLLRSVLESIAYAIRANIEQLEEVSGRSAGRVAIGGGMSRGPLPRILADVLGRPIEVARAPETSAIGAAILAAVAVGLHPSLETAVEAMAGQRTTLTPDAGVSAAYDDLYDRWCAMADTFESGTL